MGRGYFIRSKLLLRQRDLLSRNDFLFKGAWGIMQRANYLAVMKHNPLPIAAKRRVMGGR